MFNFDLDNMFDPEELCDELAVYLTTASFGKAINHPLVQSVPYIEAMNRILNQQLIVKKDALSKAINNKDWHQVVFLHERPHRLDAFVEYVPDLPREDYWSLISSIWIDSENIWRNQDLWMDMWSAPGHDFSLVMDVGEVVALASLPDEIPIFRGSQLGLPIGMSWTTDRARAEWFANRYNADHPVVHEGFVNKSSVLAYFLGRNEHEIVVMPDDVWRR